MQAIRLNLVIEKHGEIFVQDLPCKKGEQVEMIVLFESSTANLNVENREDKLWSEFTAQQFLAGYSDADEIYNHVS